MTLDPIDPIYKGKAVLLTCRFNFVIRQNEALMWTMNGTSPTTSNLQIQLIRRDNKGIMIIPNVSLTLNNTAVQCTAKNTLQLVTSNEERIYVEGSFLFVL